MKAEKVLILCCLFLCLCTGCSYGNENKPHSKYIVMNINGDKNDSEDDYFFKTSRTIYQFSISEQEIIDSIRYEDGVIDDFAVCDEYIFFLTGRGMREPEKIWRYDRESRTCEVYLETDNCYRMAVYDGNLLYGQDDVFVCPIDGNPDEDCVSLMEQFGDTDSIVQSREISYQGLRIWRVYLNSRHTYYIAQVVDEENNEIILSNSIGMTDYSAGDEIWVDGEWVYFNQDGRTLLFYYQKGFGSDRQKIECLDDRQYRYSKIDPLNMTVEGEKIFGILPVLKNLKTDDAKKDVLFEIDMENGSSRIIYDTKNSKTKIIGYQEGTVYLLKDDVIYEEDIEGKKCEKVFDLREEDFCDVETQYLREFHFYWKGNNLIIWAILDNEVIIRSFSV